MLLVDGKLYESQELPTILFGETRPLSYVLNPKAACTLALHFLFLVNHGYRYFDLAHIHFSRTALLQLHGPELDPRILNKFLKLAPETFSIVRNPLRRFVSAFVQKVLTDGDPGYVSFRDLLTSRHGIDLSPEADPARTCLAFAKWIASHDEPKSVDPHFRPQHVNLAMGGRFNVDTILRLEDRDALSAFFSKWIGAEKAKWFLSIPFNVQKYAADEIVTDELEDVVRTVYAEDYKLFYAEKRQPALAATA
jgi:hypothetical protein